MIMPRRPYLRRIVERVEATGKVTVLAPPRLLGAPSARPLKFFIDVDTAPGGGRPTIVRSPMPLGDGAAAAEPRSVEAGARDATRAAAAQATRVSSRRSTRRLTTSEAEAPTSVAATVAAEPAARQKGV